MYLEGLVEEGLMGRGEQEQEQEPVAQPDDLASLASLGMKVRKVG